MLAYDENRRAIKRANPDVAILASNFNWFLPQLAVGGDGLLSGLASLAPQLFAELWQASVADDLPGDARRQRAALSDRPGDLRADADHRHAYPHEGRLEGARADRQRRSAAAAAAGVRRAWRGHLRDGRMRHSVPATFVSRRHLTRRRLSAFETRRRQASDHVPVRSRSRRRLLLQLFPDGGVLVTIGLTVAAVAGGLVLGMGIALMRMSTNPVLSGCRAGSTSGSFAARRC